MNAVIKEYYDERVSSRLKDEYDWFVEGLKKKKIAILHLTLDSFKKRAFDCGYVLGMKPKVEDDCDVVYTEKVFFETPITIRIPFSNGNRKSGGRNPIKKIHNTQSIPGFGMSLSLSGWHIFIKNITLDKLTRKLEDGFSVEDIFRKNDIGRSVVSNGKMMGLKSACSESGIPYWTMMKKSKGLYGDDLQKCFDELKGRFSPFVRTGGNGFCWCKVSDEDFKSLEVYSASLNTNVCDALHRLIETVTY